MQKIKLMDYQLKGIQNALSVFHEQIEEMVLDKYKVHDLKDLNSLDYDNIMEDMQHWHWELTQAKENRHE